MVNAAVLPVSTFVPTVKGGGTMSRATRGKRFKILPVSNEVPTIEEGDVNRAAAGMYLAKLRECHGWSPEDAAQLIWDRYKVKMSTQTIRRIDVADQNINSLYTDAYKELVGYNPQTYAKLLFDRSATTAQAADVAAQEWKERVDKQRASMSKEFERLLSSFGDDEEKREAFIQEMRDRNLLKN